MQQQPDRGEHEHLVHHLDVEELVHHLDVVELRLHLDVQGQVEKPGCLIAANTNTWSTTSILKNSSTTSTLKNSDTTNCSASTNSSA